MSLILEALRKSEAERQLGSAPGVFAAMPILRAPAKRSPWPWMSAGFVLVIAALVLFWWRSHPLDAGQSSAHAPRAGTPKHAATHESTDQARASWAHNELRELPVINLPMTGNGQTTASTPVAVPAYSGADITIAASPSQGPTLLSIPEHSVGTPAAPSHPSNESATPPATVDMKHDAMVPATTPPVAKATPAEPALPSINELPASERGELSALKVTMYVYAEDPSQRFMIVNGQRAGEGASIADGIVIARIRRDGAEIDVHGQRVLLPKP